MFFDTNISKHDRDIWLLLDDSRVYALQKKPPNPTRFWISLLI